MKIAEADAGYIGRVSDMGFADVGRGLVLRNILDRTRLRREGVDRPAGQRHAPTVIGCGPGFRDFSTARAGKQGKANG